MEAMAWYKCLDFIFHFKIFILFFVSVYYIVRKKNTSSDSLRVVCVNFVQDYFLIYV